MGDRCAMYITVRKCDHAAFRLANDRAEMGEPDGEWTEGDGLVCMEWSQVNYAGNIEAEDIDDCIIQRPCPFWGSTGAGGCYGPLVFAYDGGDEIVCADANEDGQPVCVIRADGQPDALDLECVRAYYAALDRIRTAPAAL